MKVFIALVILGSAVYGQVRGPGGSPQGRTGAPVDITGTWVSVVTEDWRWRMVTPAKGDYASVPLSLEGKNLADQWDPTRDEAAGEQCKSYGTGGLMRVPTRLRISWQDDMTLKVETDAGTQTRLLHFDDWKSSSGTATWQGDSVARWEFPVPGRGAGPQGPPKFGNLKIVTTHMRPGYLRKNGVPYGENAVMTEYWDFNREHNGDQWIVITSVLEDSTYLQQPYITSPNFKKEADGSKWAPSVCLAKW